MQGRKARQGVEGDVGRSLSRTFVINGPCQETDAADSESKFVSGLLENVRMQA